MCRFLPLLILIFSGVAFPQTKSRPKPTPAKTSSPVVHKQVVTPQSPSVSAPSPPTNCFAHEEIDLAAERLPPGYRGNDLLPLLRSIWIEATTAKDEFETTEQYRERVAKMVAAEMVRSLPLSAKIALVIDGTFEYNADLQEMQLQYYPDGVITRMPADCDPVATNSQKYDISLKWSDNPRVILRDRKHDEKPVMLMLNFPVKLQNAREVKGNLKALLILGIVQRNGEFGTSSGAAQTRYDLNVELEQIWAFDTKTGEVYLKKAIKKDYLESLYFVPNADLVEAESSYRLGNIDNAMSKARRALITDPMNADAYLLIGKIYRIQGDNELAVNSLKSAVTWDDRKIEPHILLTRIYLEKGDCSAAKTYVSSALKLDPNNQEAKDLDRKLGSCNSLTNH